MKIKFETRLERAAHSDSRIRVHVLAEIVGASPNRNVSRDTFLPSGSTLDAVLEAEAELKRLLQADAEHSLRELLCLHAKLGDEIRSIEGRNEP